MGKCLVTNRPVKPPAMGKCLVTNRPVKPPMAMGKCPPAMGKCLVTNRPVKPLAIAVSGNEQTGETAGHG